MHAQSCPALCDPWTVACQPPLLTEFPRKNTGVGCCFPLQGIVPAQGWNSGVLHLLQWQADSLPPSHRPSYRLHQLLIHFTVYTFNVFTLHCLSSDESKPSQGKKKGALMLLNYLEHPLAQSRFSINTCRVDAA